MRCGPRTAAARARGRGAGPGARRPGRGSGRAAHRQRFRGLQALAVAHHRSEHRPGVRRSSRPPAPGRPSAEVVGLAGDAEHLLATRQRHLVRRQLHLRPGGVLDELVHDGDVGGVAARPELRSDAERVDGRARGRQRGRCGTRRGRRTAKICTSGQAALVEDGADGPGERCRCRRSRAGRRAAAASGSSFAATSTTVSGAALGVVRVDEEDRPTRGSRARTSGRRRPRCRSA